MAERTLQNDRAALIAATFLREYDNWKPIYTEIERGYNYLAGEQYTRQQIKWYEAQRRPVNVFNLIFPTFNTVIGEFLLNDQPVRVFPKPSGDAQVARVLENILDHIQINNDFKFEMAQTLLAGLIRVGYIYARFSDEKEIDGSVVITNIDEFEVLFDTRATHFFLDDAKYMLRSRWLTAEEIFRLWPQHKSKLKEILKDQKDQAYWESVDPDLSRIMQSPDLINEREGKYRVIEFHEKVIEPTEVAFNPRTGEAFIFNLEGKRRDIFLRANPDVRLVERNEEVKKITSVLPAFDYILEEKEADVQDGTFDIIPYFAYNYGKRTYENYGIMQNAIGPQNDFNDWRNRSADIINKSANAPVIYKPSDLINPQDVRNYGSQPGLQIEVKENRDISKAIRFEQPPKFPFATDQMSKEALDLLMRITNITPNFLGYSEHAQEPASLFAQKLRQAQKAVAVMDFNLRRTKRRLFNKVIRLVQTNYTTERYFLVTNPHTGTQEEVVLNLQLGNRILNDVRVGEYEVFVDDLERNPTARAIRFMQKTELVQLIVSWLGPAAIDYDWWLDESDLGDINKLKERINAVLSQMLQQGQKEEAVALTNQILETARKKMELEGTNSEANSPAGLPLPELEGAARR